MSSPDLPELVDRVVVFNGGPAAGQSLVLRLHPSAPPPPTIERLVSAPTTVRTAAYLYRGTALLASGEQRWVYEPSRDALQAAAAPAAEHGSGSGSRLQEGS